MQTCYADVIVQPCRLSRSRFGWIGATSVRFVLGADQQVLVRVVPAKARYFRSARSSKIANMASLPSKISQKMFEIAGEVKCAFNQNVGLPAFVPGSLVFNYLGSSYNCSIVCSHRKPRNVKVWGCLEPGF